jgi:hypothetical protein
MAITMVAFRHFPNATQMISVTKSGVFPLASLLWSLLGRKWSQWLEMLAVIVR